MCEETEVGGSTTIKITARRKKNLAKRRDIGYHVTRNKSHKPVRVLSSVTNPTAPVTTVKRKQKDGTLKDISCPEPIKLYNMFMNGVDCSDQM